MGGIGVRPTLRVRGGHSTEQDTLGPVLMTVGPWKPIKLETYTARIIDVDIRTTISPELNATVNVNFSLSISGRVVSSVQILSPSGALVIGQRGLRVDTLGKANFGLSKGAYDLWWPVGYGEQPMYTVEITIEDQVCSKSLNLISQNVV